MENKALKTLKPVNKILGLVSIAASLVAIAVLVLFCFSDVITIITDEGTKYAEGFSYPGWQTIFAGVGNMIIQGYTEAGFNIWTCLALFLPLISCLVGAVMLSTNYARRGTNLKRAIVDGIAAICLIYGAFIFLNIDKMWIAAAKAVEGSYTYYYEVYLVPAMNGELYFGKDYFADVTFAVLLIVGLIKAANCGCLLAQKYIARKVNSQSVVVK